jgi:hypothetical protein
MPSRTGKAEGHVSVSPNLFDRANLKWGPIPGGREGDPPKQPEAIEQASKFLRSLPRGIGRTSVDAVAHAMRTAVSEERPVFWALGLEALQAGVAPQVIDLMNRDMVSCVVLDGDAARYDVETGLFGQGLRAPQQNGVEAGLWDETGALWAEALRRGRGRRLGIGWALGDAIVQRKSRFADESILAACVTRGIPCTVHAAMGCLGLELHADFSGGDWGEAAHIDLRGFMQAAMKLGDGVWIQAAEFMPLGRLLCRALALMNNLGVAPDRLTCAILGIDPRHAVTEELRALFGGEGPRNGRRVELVPGALDLVIPLLRAAIFPTGALPDLYRDL